MEEKKGDYVPPPILGKKEDYPEEFKRMMDRQSKELSKGIFIRCRNTMEKRLSREFHDIEVSIVINPKMMRRSGHEPADLHLSEKIDLYCKREGINRNRLNLLHLGLKPESK